MTSTFIYDKAQNNTIYMINQVATTRIGHYILGKTIGSGGFAQVKEAHHDLTGVKVAVKIINKARMNNDKMISKVKRQIRILKFLNHPNIIKLYEVLDTTADIFVVMEMAGKGELCEYLQNNQLEEQQIKHLFKKIIDGVEFAHFNLVAHRDLKLENILLDSGLNPKIADFGLSNLMKDGKFLKTSCGSPNYAAPEILQHKEYEGTSVDVWSCGIILYTLLFRVLPFDQEVVSILYKMIQKAEFTLPGDVNPLVQDLLHRMIQPDPAKRIKVCDIKTHPWLRKTVQIYAKMPTLGLMVSSMPVEIDQEILDKVRGYNMESLSRNHDEDRIKRILRGRLDASFVTAYELLKDAKQSKERTLSLSNSTSESSNLIFTPVNNPLEQKKLESDRHHVFGKSFTISPIVLVDKVIEAFKEMKIQYIVKNSNYSLLGTFNAYPNFSRKNIAKMQKILFGMKFHSQGRDVVIDFRLAEGHPLTFITMCQRIYTRVEELLKA